jgi:transcriptional regulator with XRE-family HTH domain
MSSPPTKENPAHGLALRHWRMRRGLTQHALSRKADLHPAAISHFETGERSPALESLLKLADALEITVDALLGREERKKGAPRTRLERLTELAERLGDRDMDLLLALAEAMSRPRRGR